MSLFFSKLLAFNRVRYWREASHGLNRVSHFIGRALAWEPSFQRAIGVISCWLDVQKKGIVNYIAVERIRFWFGIMYRYKRFYYPVFWESISTNQLLNSESVSNFSRCTRWAQETLWHCKVNTLDWCLLLATSVTIQPLSNGKCGDEMRPTGFDLWELNSFIYFCREGQVWVGHIVRQVLVSEWKMSWLRTFFFVLVYYVIVAASDTNRYDEWWRFHRWWFMMMIDAEAKPVMTHGAPKSDRNGTNLCRLFFFSHFLKIHHGVFSREQRGIQGSFLYKWYLFLLNETFKRPWEVLASHIYFSSNVSVELESLQDDCCLYKSEVIFPVNHVFLYGRILVADFLVILSLPTFSFTGFLLQAEVCDLRHSLFLGVLCGIRMGLCHLLCQGLIEPQKQTASGSDKQPWMVGHWIFWDL